MAAPPLGRAPPASSPPCCSTVILLPPIYTYVSPNDQIWSQNPNSTTATFCIHEIPSWGLFQVAKKSNIKRSPNGMKPWERDFLNEQDQGDLDPTSRHKRGGHEVGGAPTPPGAPSTLVGPSWLHRPTSSSYIYLRTPKPSRSITKTYFHRRNLLYP